MKKRTILIIILSIIIMISIGVLSFTVPINNENIIKIKGNLLFGKRDRCNTMFEALTDDITERKCILCNKKYMGSSSRILCGNCCTLTGRCLVCGKYRND